MPRLLLVDDNPSIHRIAESLLAPTDVELVCVASAAEALDRLGRGERFDVALVDTAMPGMDGWTLVARLRASADTATLPIALMAGVLDPVDPSRLAKAPVQGFLKKPIELRELGDRVKSLIATPVVPTEAPSPYSTVPSTPARELLQRAEHALPEFRGEVVPGGAEPVEEDLLVLDADDLWPEAEAAGEPAAPVAAVALEEAPEVQLELEELDLEALQLTPAIVPAARLEPPAPELEPALAPLPDLDELDLTLEGEPAVPVVPTGEEVTAAGSGPGPLMEEVLASLHPTAPVREEIQAFPETAVAPDAAPGQVPAAPSQAPAAPAPAPLAGAPGDEGQARAVVQALLADPVLVDALVRAIVARMGDQVIREIAWEVMPDLAEKLRS